MGRDCKREVFQKTTGVDISGFVECRGLMSYLSHYTGNPFSVGAPAINSLLVHIGLHAP